MVVAKLLRPAKCSSKTIRDPLSQIVVASRCKASTKCRRSTKARSFKVVKEPIRGWKVVEVCNLNLDESCRAKHPLPHRWRVVQPAHTYDTHPIYQSFHLSMLKVYLWTLHHSSLTLPPLSPYISFT